MFTQSSSVNRSRYMDSSESTPARIKSVDTRTESQGVDDNVTRNAMEKITSGIDSIVIRSSLPPLDVVKFSGDPHEYYRFKSRFHEMVDSQNISDAQKMSRLLQFLDGKAQKAVAGFEGVPGGLKSALRMLEQRFGQPHIIAKSCVDALIDGPNISSNNYQALQEFADCSRTWYETLKSMNALHEMNTSNLSKMSGKLPISLQIKWRDEVQRLRDKGHFPCLEDLVKFIEKRADAASDPVFGRVGETHKTFQNLARSNRRPPQTSSPHVARATTLMTHATAPSVQSSNSPKVVGMSDLSCFICGSSHKIENCQEFASKAVRQRVQLARQKGLCLNCLRKGHFVAQCQSKFKCKECQQQHHSLLHKSSEEKDTDKKENTNSATKPSGNAISMSVNTKKSADRADPIANKRVALQVVPIKILGNGHRSTSTYALLDTGSEDTFISKDIADKLGIQITDYDNLSVCTLSGESTVRVGRVDLEVKAVDNENKDTVKIEDVKVIENLNIDTSRPRDLSRWPHLADIVIPEVDVKEVLMLIGANVPEAQVHVEYRVGNAGEPYAVRTLLGWAVLGPLDGTNLRETPKVNVNHVKYGDNVSDQQMNQFLRLEDIEMNKTSKQAMSIEDKESLRRMEDSVRVVDGHYEVGMLWKSEQPWLPDNILMAKARLRSLKRRLQSNEIMHEKYRDFVNNMLSKGYAKNLTAEEARKRSNKTWYLPHHGVFHPQKKDKLRVVFDAAAQYNGISLNNQLNQGPDLSNSLLGILLRFRQDPIALIADIEGMFNQVKVPDEDADALRFLWWKDGNLEEEPSEFQMTTHIFGATDSPSCANYCLKKAAEDNKDNYSEEAVNAIKNDFYVDDLVKSVKSVQEARSLSGEVTRLLKGAGFRLTKWMSNCREVLASIPNSERCKPTLDLDLDELPLHRTLGVEWDVEKDVFAFKINDLNKPATKRGILSTVSSLYDPIGFVSPVLLEAKTLLQKLWKLNLDWDEPIPQEIERQWSKWKRELSSLSTIQIPRVYLIAETDIVDTSLHVFADASEEGYGMCAYLRFVQANNAVKCAFLIGRSRSSPVRPISIPRLELQAATLAVRIYRVLIDELTCKIDRAIFWTDSQTTLQYIMNVTKRFQVYVANRVAEIREVTTPEQWKHCPGRLNPADDASRGLSPKKLSNRHRWWKGPDFLWQKEESWPDIKVNEVCNDDPELRKEVKVNQTTTKTIDNGQKLKTLIEHCGSWTSLQRRIAWLVRFCHYIAKKKTNGYQNGPLTLEELNQATRVIVKVIQADTFPEELSGIQTKGEVKRTSGVADLRPIISDGVLRVGGRLQNATELSMDERHPMILPKRHHLSELIVRHYHETAGHSGREQTLCEMRRQFWIVSGRTLVKNAIRTCIKCRRMNARPLEQVMGPLPKARLEAYCPPFTYTGVDLFGPLVVKWGRGTAKRWGCLFTCLNTRAVYLEVVPSLEADDFIMVLRQFISRRGPPKEIWSDRGTNFVGADRELREAIAQWNEERIEKQLQQKGIKWIFQPPASPHMSGVWERLVKITKKHLKVIAGESLLNDLGLRTLLAEVEFIVNNRPITAVSDDPTDLAALTPNHFLLQRTTQLPPGVFIKEDQFSRRRWKRVQFLVNCYWKRWIKEYLPSLQRRAKWWSARRNVQPGDLVMVADDNVARNRWPLARVQETLEGRDGKVRSAKIKTSGGILHRPIAKLCLLEEVN